MNSENRKSILIVALYDKSDFEGRYKYLLSHLDEFVDVKRVTTPDEVLDALDDDTKPNVVLVADGAIVNYYYAYTKLKDRISKNGSLEISQEVYSILKEAFNVDGSVTPTDNSVLVVIESILNEDDSMWKCVIVARALMRYIRNDGIVVCCCDFSSDFATPDSSERLDRMWTAASLRWETIPHNPELHSEEYVLLNRGAIFPRTTSRIMALEPPQRGDPLIPDLERIEPPRGPLLTPNIVPRESEAKRWDLLGSWRKPKLADEHT